MERMRTWSRMLLLLCFVTLSVSVVLRMSVRCSDADPLLKFRWSVDTVALPTTAALSRITQNPACASLATTCRQRAGEPVLLPANGSVGEDPLHGGQELHLVLSCRITAARSPQTFAWLPQEMAAVTAEHPVLRQAAGAGANSAEKPLRTGSSPAIQEAAALLRESERLGHKHAWRAPELGPAEELAIKAVRLDPASQEARAHLGTLRHWMRKDSASIGQRCATPPQVSWAMCRDNHQVTVPYFSHDVTDPRRSLVIFEAVLRQMGDIKSVTMIAFVRRGRVARYGNQAVMSAEHARQLRDFVCIFPGSATRSTVDVIEDLPYKVHLRCNAPAAFPLPGAVPGLQLTGLLDGTTTTVILPLCAHKVRERSQVALCSAPLFLGPGLPPRRIVEWIEYHRILGLEHFHIFDRDDSLGLLLADLERLGIVSRHVWPLFEPDAKLEVDYYDQHIAQDACLLRHSGVHDWVLFLDPDEFLHHADRKRNALRGYLDELQQGDRAVAQVMLQNLLVAGQPLVPSGPLVEQYIMRANVTVPWRQKPLVHAPSIEFMWAHFASRLLCGRTVMAHPASSRVNHYMAADGRKLKDPEPSVKDLSATWIVPALKHRISEHYSDMTS